MDIASKIERIKSNLPDNIKLVAVSKTKPNEDILEAYNAGHKIFGENKVQELSRKYEELPKDIEWHFIGHLQTNKVKFIAPFVSLIHGVDTFKLLKTINKEAEKHDRIISCLLQFHIATESTKFGFSLHEVKDMLKSGEIAYLKNVQIAGVMGMATYTNDEKKVSSEFNNLHRIFETLKEEFFADYPAFSEISMGMSDDFPIAVEEGSTIIRIGSKIFGERNYKKTNS